MARPARTRKKRTLRSEGQWWGAWLGLGRQPGRLPGVELGAEEELARWEERGRVLEAEGVPSREDGKVGPCVLSHGGRCGAGAREGREVPCNPMAKDHLFIHPLNLPWPPYG